MPKRINITVSITVSITVLALLCLFTVRSNAAIRYVKPGNAGTAPYSSWATASNDLQAVINQCVAGDDIWVAAGTYIPNRRADATGTITLNDRDNAFVLKYGVRIFGGFNGTETATSQRNFAVNICILSGDLGTAGNTTDNCYHVVVCAGTVTGTALNGFFIRYGNANGSGIITVNAISVGRGSGAGMRISSASPTISNCVFSANSTTNNGGGLVCDNSSSAVTNCVFSGNRANDGGAMLNTNSSATEITNCTFAGNIASVTGGAIRNGNSSSPLISNCVIWNNWVGLAADAIYNADAGSLPVVNYCVVQGGYGGTGNINTNPLFVNSLSPTFAPTVVGDYRVQKCGPCINAGNNSFVPGSINNDLDYTPRINYGIVDIGAYELQLSLAVPDANGIVYVDYTKAGNGSSWANAVAELADALAEARYNTAIQQIWVAKGTYFPMYPFYFETKLCNAANAACTFALTNGLKVYGGFAGVETDTTGRNFSINKTTLSGDIGILGNISDNCNNVLRCESVAAGSEFNGFTITKGVNSGMLNNHSGLTIENCNFFLNISSGDGGAMINFSASPVIASCSFVNNTADNRGGAIFNLNGSNIKIYKCYFLENTAATGGAIANISDAKIEMYDSKVLSNQSWGLGGGILLEQDSDRSKFINCIISGNESTNVGGGICSHNASEFINCLVSGNRSAQAGGIHFRSGAGTTYLVDNCTIAGNVAETTGGAMLIGDFTAVVRNSIIFGNSGVTIVDGAADIQYSTVQGSLYPGTGNINSNPLFVNPFVLAPSASGDFHLQKCSPSINVGDNASIPSGITKDLDSNSRITFGIVDMGAYEKHLVRPDANGIVYVDSSNIAGAGDGSSWAKAITELADALKEAKTNTDIKEIWAAKGTYKPIYNADDAYLNSICHSTDRDASFVLVPDVKLYGGFAGGESSLSERNYSLNQTTMSGDRAILNDTTDNCYHVIISSNTENAIVDGFDIVHGNARAPFTSITVNGLNISRTYAGAFYSNKSPAEIKNCRFMRNSGHYGGALHIQSVFGDFTSQTVVRNTKFIENVALEGAAINNAGKLVIENCRVSGNQADIGGGVINFDKITIINSVITGNNALLRGGAIRNHDSVNLYNSVIYGNRAVNEAGGGISNTVGSKLNRICNSIIYNNLAVSNNNILPGSALPVVSHSIIEGGHAGIGNFNLDPLFISPVGPLSAPTISGDYRLQACSPAINSGNNDSIPAGINYDLDSLSRIMFSIVDMGAYEKQDVDLGNTTWKGINTNWNDKINWCGGYIPADTTNVLVPVTSNNPFIQAGYDNEVKNILFANNTTIGIANTSKLTINGTYANSGSTITNNGTWVMTGTATSQTFPGLSATVSAMKNLEINNPNGIKFDKSFEITGILIPDDGNINVDNATVTLNSDASGTARIEAVPPTVAFSYTGTGKFEIERYIPPHRAWRLLTAPLSTTTNLTISQAWQEGVSNANRLSPVDPSPGFGTTITKSTTYNAADGYDHGSTNNPSIRYYNGANWGGVPTQTNGTTPGANNGLMNDQQGYMLFVRGNRAIQVAGTGVAASVTTLRPKGQLKVGPQTIVCNGWTVVGNPYASPINFHKIVLDNPGLPDVFYMWDANLAGSGNVGGWISYGAYDGGSQTYTVTPQLPGSSFANNRGDISSGSAFMVNYTGTITITENHKSTLGDNILFRPVRQLGINLYVVNGDSSLSLNDGLAIHLDAPPHAASAEKNTNFTENLAILSEGKRYAIQNRPRPQFNDSIFIYSGQMKPRNYVLELKADELEMPPNMKAWLEDTYLRRYLKVSLHGSTRYPFTVFSDSTSFTTGRFRLLFRKSPRFADVQAAEKGADIQVKWQMDEAFGVHQYEIERSINGTDFITAGRRSETRNVFSNSLCQWLDTAPGTGTYYYRIKAICMEGDIYYSDVVRADRVDNSKGMYVYPSPVTGNYMQLRLNKQPPGVYQVRLTSITGQIFLTQQFRYRGGYESVRLDLPGQPAAGCYQLQVIKPGGMKDLMEVFLHR